MMKKFKCAHCGKQGKRFSGHVNRSKKDGAQLYCNLKCFGLARRKNKTSAQKKQEKRLYDQKYRAKNIELLKRKKAAYYQLTRDPAKEAIARKKRMYLHVEYCRRPEYKAWKRDYDRRFRASEYGKFADAHMLLVDIEREVRDRITDYEIRVQNGTINKHLQRRRHYEQVTGNR